MKEGRGGRAFTASGRSHVARFAGRSRGDMSEVVASWSPPHGIGPIHAEEAMASSSPATVVSFEADGGGMVEDFEGFATGVQQHFAEPQVGPQQHATLGDGLSDRDAPLETLIQGPHRTVNTITATPARADRIGTRSACLAWRKCMVIRSETRKIPRVSPSVESRFLTVKGSPLENFRDHFIRSRQSMICRETSSTDVSGDVSSTSAETA